jgi:hypothetical protein
MNQQGIKTGIELTVWAMWLGALFFLALLVAPALFRWLPRAHAGLVAGRLFYMMSWYSLLTCALLLAFSKLQFKWVLVGVLAVCVLELLWLHPRLGQLRQTMQEASADELLVLKASFGTLHMVSSALYAIKMVGAFLWGLRRFSVKVPPSL